MVGGRRRIVVGSSTSSILYLGRRTPLENLSRDKKEKKKKELKRKTDGRTDILARMARKTKFSGEETKERAILGRDRKRFRHILSVSYEVVAIRPTNEWTDRPTDRQTDRSRILTVPPLCPVVPDRVGWYNIRTYTSSSGYVPSHCYCTSVVFRVFGPGQIDAKQTANKKFHVKN